MNNISKAVRLLIAGLILLIICAVMAWATDQWFAPLSSELGFAKFILAVAPGLVGIVLIIISVVLITDVLYARRKSIEGDTGDNEG